MYDLIIEREEYSRIVLAPQTQRGKFWCAMNLSTTPTIGDAFVIAPEDFADLANALREEGLSVEHGD